MGNIGVFLAFKINCHMSNVISRILVLVACIFLFQISFSQKRTITGTVTDEKSSPLIGASVNVAGAEGGTTITGPLGMFSITVPLSAKTLVISYVCMESQTVSIGTGILKVSLKPISSVLNDVVVIGYGTVKKSDLTRAIASIKGE